MNNAFMASARRPLTHQSVAYTAAAASIANAFGNDFNGVIRVICTTAAHVKIGMTPTATTSDVYMPAGVPEYFMARPGEKLSAIRAASDGTVHVTEMTG